MVKVIPMSMQKTVQRAGFLKGQIKVPADFDRLGQNEIINAFEGSDETVSQYSPVVFVN